jgi:hypothetical protein
MWQNTKKVPETHPHPPKPPAIDIDIDPSAYTNRNLRFPSHPDSASKKLQLVFVRKGGKIIWKHF